MKNKIIISAAAVLAAIPGLLSCRGGAEGSASQADSLAIADSIPAIGFKDYDMVKVETELRSGEVFGSMMGRLGIDGARSAVLAEACDTIFNLRKLRAGNKVDAFFADSASAEALSSPAYVVYHESRTSAVVFDCGDSVAVWRYVKPVETQLLATDITISNSLWVDMKEAGADPLLILKIEEIYEWTVDFFSLQKGDRFRAAYRQSLCDGEVISVDKIEYAVFNREEKEIPAIYFDQGDGGNKWWNGKGESLRKAFLKAPLQFSRISSGFSYARRHPISGKVRAHTAVDYAAPMGTPVRSIGNGSVISAGWAGGGGNTVKIRHANGYVTSYMHLSRYASGIKAGAAVSQGQVIGYVGSTGSSTGPHLDFRVYKNGTAINPLRMEAPSEAPINKENLPALDSAWHCGTALLDSLLRER
ncbi:MAG: M23 family metallopeptidase [Bacteroidales bacterium]|nr:M23 family metallopeptidase [Bacteroidales bacterium]